MAEQAPAAPTAATTAPKPPKKKGGAASSGKPKKKRGPTATECIMRAIVTFKTGRGVSSYALRKACAAEGYDMEHNRHHFNCSLKRLCTKGLLVQTSGVGASGSFKMAKPMKKEKEGKKKVTTVAKARKPAPKKTAGARGTRVKKRAPKTTKVTSTSRSTAAKKRRATGRKSTGSRNPKPAKTSRAKKTRSPTKTQTKKKAGPKKGLKTAKARTVKPKNRAAKK